MPSSKKAWAARRQSSADPEATRREPRRQWRRQKEQAGDPHVVVGAESNREEKIPQEGSGGRREADEQANSLDHGPGDHERQEQAGQASLEPSPSDGRRARSEKTGTRERTRHRELRDSSDPDLEAGDLRGPPGPGRVDQGDQEDGDGLDGIDLGVPAPRSRRGRCVKHGAPAPGAGAAGAGVRRPRRARGVAAPPCLVR